MLLPIQILKSEYFVVDLYSLIDEWGLPESEYVNTCNTCTCNKYTRNKAGNVYKLEKISSSVKFTPLVI